MGLSDDGASGRQSLARVAHAPTATSALRTAATTTSTVIPVQLPSSRSDVRLTRAELERLIDEPLGGFLDALGDVLERNRIPVASLAAVATTGGGAAIPLITQRLSELQGLVTGADTWTV